MDNNEIVEFVNSWISENNPRYEKKWKMNPRKGLFLFSKDPIVKGSYGDNIVYTLRNYGNIHRLSLDYRKRSVPKGQGFYLKLYEKIRVWAKENNYECSKGQPAKDESGIYIVFGEFDEDWNENSLKQALDKMNGFSESKVEEYLNLVSGLEKEYSINPYKMELNENLCDKIKNLLLYNHNIILHGAPGTGKTYLAKKIAKEMIFGDAEKTLTPEEQEQFNERCGFVQFHQSYDYTDFVEGLRPVNQVQGKIGFELKDGVFKAFCKKALKTMVGEKPSFDGAKDNQYWKEKCIEFLDRNCSVDKKRFFSVSGGEFYIIERNEDSIQIEIPKNPQTSHLSIKINDLIEVVKHQDLKYVKDVRKILNRPEKENGEIYHTQGDSYLYAIAQEINESIAEKNIYFVFIIDEINRGEMSKIFGELFFSIDPGYRGEKGKIKTQYQNLIDAKDPFADGFFIPKNVYIIGTMNDIDRSVESMDFAMRRRFAFKEIQAKDRIEMLDEIKDEKLRKLAITKMKALNTAIEKTEGLSSAYHIGPAYFLKLNKYGGDFDKLWKFHVEGVVREYLRGMDDVDGKKEKIETAYKDAKTE